MEKLSSTGIGLGAGKAGWDRIRWEASLKLSSWRLFPSLTKRHWLKESTSNIFPFFYYYCFRKSNFSFWIMSHHCSVSLHSLLLPPRSFLNCWNPKEHKFWNHLLIFGKRISIYLLSSNCIFFFMIIFKLTIYAKIWICIKYVFLCKNMYI